MVRKGRVMPGSSVREVVKGGTRITYTAGAPLVAKLDKKNQDDFDRWSKTRAETLAQANRKISGRTLNGYLASMNGLDWAFSARNSWGFWTYSSFSRCFTFVPFGYGWSSPYGHSYGNYFYYSPYRYGYGNGVIVANPTSSGSSPYPGGSSSGPGPSGPTGSPSMGPSAPSSSMGSQAGPRDPDSGSRSINRIKDPNN
jgi:hypothetical protein